MGYTMLQPLSTRSIFSTILWALQVPRKKKIHTWKVYNDCVPTYVNLSKRHLANPGIFPLCKIDYESVDHMIRFCPFFLRVLSELQVLCLNGSNCSNHMVWLEKSFGLGNDRHRQRFISLWATWFASNKIVQSVQQVKGFISGFIAELEAMNTINLATPVRHSTIWKPPVHDSVKINFDCSYDQASKTSYSGVLIRNEKGLVIGACTYPHSHVANVFVAKARACGMAIHFAQDLGFVSFRLKVILSQLSKNCNRGHKTDLFYVRSLPLSRKNWSILRLLPLPMFVEELTK